MEKQKQGKHFDGHNIYNTTLHICSFVCSLQ